MAELRYHPRIKSDLKSLPQQLVTKPRSIHLPAIGEDPLQGSTLSGPFKGVFSYHLRHARTRYRIAYLYDGEQGLVTLLLIAERENFYQILSRRLP